MWVVWSFFKKMDENSYAAEKWTQQKIMEDIVLGMFWRMWAIDTVSYNLPQITF